jgi:predicted Zn finger-like uncharacterized protein
MIIQCDQCRSKFEVEQNLIPEEGRKVRCSQCQHVFKAFPEQETAAEVEEMTVLDEVGAEEESMVDEAEEEETAAEETAEQVDDAEEKEEMPEEVSPMEEALEAEPAAEAEKKKPKTTFLRVLILIILVLLGAAVAIRLWVPSDLVPDYLRFLKPFEETKVSDAGIRRLSFVAVTGSFVKSEKSGSLFVIRGKVRNDYPKSRSFIRLKGTILDENGQAMREKFGYAGNTFTEDVIKELSLEEMNQTMNDRFGMGKSNVDVSPGQAIPFTLVFENLPENMSEFTVEAVSSSPGV